MRNLKDEGIIMEYMSSVLENTKIHIKYPNQIKVIQYFFDEIKR